MGPSWEKIFWEIPEIPAGLLYGICIAMCSVWLEAVGASVKMEKLRGCLSISFTRKWNVFIWAKWRLCGWVEFCADIVDFHIVCKWTWIARHHPLKCTSEE